MQKPLTRVELLSVVLIVVVGGGALLGKVDLGAFQRFAPSAAKPSPVAVAAASCQGKALDPATIGKLQTFDQGTDRAKIEDAIGKPTCDLGKVSVRAGADTVRMGYLIQRPEEPGSPAIAVLAYEDGKLAGVSYQVAK